jgi:PAS domain S-box-containing protein
MPTGEETRFRALLEAAPDAMIVVGEAGRISLVNTQTEALFRYDRRELLGEPIEILLPEQLRQAHVAHREGYYAQPRRRPMGECLDLVARRKDGSEFPTEISLSPLHLDDTLAVIVVVRDLTERKKQEEDRAALAREQAARAEAEAANRAKDEFVAMVSHELRTPLNAILGWASLLRTRSLEPHVVQRALETIERNAQAQRQLIDDLMDISRMVTGKIALVVEDVDLSALIHAATESLKHAAEVKRLRLDVLLASPLPRLAGDPHRLQQVIWNLLSNAIKFTPEGGAVRVSALHAGGQVELQVSDTGIGIAAEFLPHVFERFRQRDPSTTRAYGGLGLGLAIVRQLVELHGGRVVVESAGEGLGTTFTVTLPAPAAAPARRNAPASAAEPRRADLAGLRVLVADDDGETREVLEAALMGAGAHVTLAASGSVALREAERQLPDVLVSDIAMPGMDGYELLREVRARDATVPAVALTAYGREADRTRAVAAGFDAHLAKPVLPDTLLDTVARVARRGAVIDGQA